jgi:HicA toxin of bacterial toxin-antitoxin,
MTNLPVLSGHEVITALGKIGFQVKRQKGSHIILANESSKLSGWLLCLTIRKLTLARLSR